MPLLSANLGQNPFSSIGSDLLMTESCYDETSSQEMTTSKDRSNDQRAAEKFSGGGINRMTWIRSRKPPTFSLLSATASGRRPMWTIKRAPLLVDAAAFRKCE